MHSSQATKGYPQLLKLALVQVLKMSWTQNLAYPTENIDVRDYLIGISSITFQKFKFTCDSAIVSTIGRTIGCKLQHFARSAHRGGKTLYLSTRASKLVHIPDNAFRKSDFCMLSLSLKKCKFASSINQYDAINPSLH